MREGVKDKIVKVARETFKQFGFRKTTMDEIAYAARKGKSSLYYYFKSKEEVFNAVVELEGNMLKKQIKDAIAGVEDPREKLKKYIITRMLGFKQMINFYVAIKDDYLSNLDFIEKTRKKFDQDEMEIVRAILQNGIETKVFKSMDLTLTSRTLVIIMKGLEIPMFINDEFDDIEYKVDQLLEILYKGLEC